MAETVYTQAAVDQLIANVSTGGVNPFGSRLVPLSSFAGANDSARFRTACSSYSAAGKPVIVLPNGCTLDAGANNPFVLPTGFHMIGSPGPEDETGHQCTVNLRHTGSDPADAPTHGTFRFAPASRDQKITNITFKGTLSTRAFCDVNSTGSSGDFPQYLTLTSISFNGFESIYQGTGTGIKWMGACYLNNFSATREPIYLSGSDHTLWSNGCLWEMGGGASYATRSALSAMFRAGNLSNTSIGPVYWTGSPTTPVRIDGGVAGLSFMQAVLEGRPSAGTVGEPPTGGLHCNGPLVRMTNGRASFDNREWGNAMRDPRSSVHGYQPGGFIHQSGGDLVIKGGTFQPFAANVYPAWTRPDGVAVAAGQQPPFAWITGASTRCNFSNIQRGPNCTSAPIVFAAAGAVVLNDGSVNVVTV